MFNVHTLNTKIILFIAIILIPLSSISQRSRKSKGKIIKATTGIQTTFAPIEYSFTSFSFSSESENIDLTFLTAESGTFVVEESRLVNFNYQGEYTPTPLSIGIGLGIQIINAKGNFHDISLTRLSLSNTTSKARIDLTDNTGFEDTFFVGAEDKSFSIGLRYQIGRYLGDPDSSTKFGFAIVLDPIYHRFERKNYTSNIFPIRSNIFNLHIGLSPMLNFKLSEKVSLTTKLIPQVRIAAIENVLERNPSIPPNQQNGTIESSSNYFSMSGAITLEYVLKEPRRRRRR